MPNERELTTEEIKMLAKAERDMDSGALSYVVNNGQRWSIPDDTMQQLGLEAGESASDFLIQKILETNIANLTAEIARRKMPN